MYYADEHTDEIFEKASTMTVEDIFLYRDIVRQAIRNKLSGLLIDSREDDVYECQFPIYRNREYFGLSELEMPYIDMMYSDNDGHIWLHLEGDDDDRWTELEDFDTDDMVEFIKEIVG